MKKVFAVILAVLVLVGCASTENTPGNASNIDIVEETFVSQASQILNNRAQYLGRTVRFEGMVLATSYWEDEPFHFVYRNTYGGCCGQEGIIGFDVALNDIEPFSNDAWVEVIGVFEEFDILEGRVQIPIINATSIREMPERGLEFVSDSDHVAG